MHHYQLYIFDWDGTLMNSIDKIVSSLQYAASHAGLTVPSVQACKSIIGAGLKDACNILFPNANREELYHLELSYRQHFIHLNRHASPMYPGSITLLNVLQQQNKKLAIATSKGRDGLMSVLNEVNLTTTFNCLRTSDDAKAKPHPDMLEQILFETQTKASQAVYIGDSRYDIAMANNAGLDSIAISHGAGHIDELKQSKPTCLVHSLFELKEIIS